MLEMFAYDFSFFNSIVDDFLWRIKSITMTQYSQDRFGSKTKRNTLANVQIKGAMSNQGPTQ